MSKHTEVVLRAEVENLGHAGDVVEVAPGYARNYLLPQRLAYIATAANKRRIEQERKKYEQTLREEQVKAEEVAAAMAGLVLEFQMMAGDEDQLYGSVSTADIAERLVERGFVAARGHVRLDNPIKTLGDYEVSVRLHPEVSVPIRVLVTRDQG
jgi:large subunit ribosomal protein L9